MTLLGRNGASVLNLVEVDTWIEQGPVEIQKQNHVMEEWGNICSVKNKLVLVKQ